jgi:proteic killer suppression protein
LQIKFKTKKLQKQYENHSLAIKEYGQTIAKRYIMRINTIQNSKTIDDLYHIPTLKFHPLKGNRSGEYTIALSGFYRLIIKDIGDNEFNIVRIEEVSKHYGD